MSIIAIRQNMTADDSHTIHITLPPEMGDEVEVIVLPRSVMPEESLIQAKLADESGFVKSLLNNEEEDCWNGL